jgi:hypothetical protein
VVNLFRHGRLGFEVTLQGCYLNERGKPYAAKSIAAMVASIVGAGDGGAVMRHEWYRRACCWERFGVVRYHLNDDGEAAAWDDCGWFDTLGNATERVVAVLLRRAASA